MPFFSEFWISSIENVLDPSTWLPLFTYSISLSFKYSAEKFLYYIHPDLYIVLQ